MTQEAPKVQETKPEKDLVDRLSRSFATSERAAKLDLPKDLDDLLQLFLQFETNIFLSKHRKGPWQTSLESILDAVESSYGKKFTEERFRQMLSVVPDFYLHKWEFKQGRPVLLVDIPQNIH